MKEFFKYLFNVLKQPDKLLHMSAGFVLMVLFSTALSLTGMSVFLILLISFLLVAFVGGAKEGYDYIHDGHSAEMMDFVADMIGAITALVLVLILLLR